MPKGKRKRDKKGKATWTGAAEFWAPLARQIVGNFAGQVMAHKTTKSSRSKDSDEKGSHPRKHRDVAGEVVRILAESGPRSVAQLVAETRIGLSPLLRALRESREFRLVELVGDDDIVQLTPSGNRVASALRREEIEADGRKLLES